MRTMTRRTLLTAGTVAAGGAGALAVGEAERGRRWLHSVGLLDGPDLRPPDVPTRVVRAVLDSGHMAGPVDWAVSVPAVEPTAVLLCLHGRGSTHRFAFDTIGVHRFVADQGRPWVVVGVDGGTASYWHRRTDGTDARAMVFEELLPSIELRFGHLPLFLLGWSMGGFGALAAAATYPGRIKAVAATSPALWRRFDQSAPGAFDSAADFETNNVFGRIHELRRQRIRIDCGDDDPFEPVARQLAAELPNAQAAFGPGFHDAAFWRSRIPMQLDYLASALQD